MEIKARELEGRSLLAFEAASRGYRVILGDKNPLYPLLCKGFLPNGMYIYKSLGKGSEKHLLGLSKKGFLISSQDEESGLLDKTYDKFLEIRSTQRLVNIASAVYCWGKHDYSSWIRKYPDSANKIYCVGSPRVDYWRSDFINYFNEDIKKIKSKWGSYVLISSNFVLANHPKGTEDLIALRKEIGFISTEEDEKRMRANINDSKKMFRLFIELIKKLSLKYPDIKFIIRPHPLENKRHWENLFKKCLNIHVVSNGGVTAWIKSAKALIHNGCTCGIEAYVSNIPTIAYTPFESSINREVPNTLSITCTTEEEVDNKLRQVLQRDIFTIEKYKNKIIKNRLLNVCGNTASKSIVDTFDLLDIPSSESISYSITTTQQLIKKIKRKLGTKKLSYHKFPSLSRKEMLLIKEKLSRINTNYRSVNIKKISNRIFVLEK